ncbi:protein KRBA1 isoform X7 [Bufo bufo]|uniref:protein KRBA1 isoform X7 n=1 Tax=Bufo bufo TaxID=8384 RepID=UPI001ABE2E27|nr:protein KRBA1 isoform X7 [Bufo bufo]
MMSHCLVRGCRNASGRTDISVSFHPFPANRETAERWASLCGVSGQECSQLLKDLDRGDVERYQLCSLHFEQEAFEIKPDDKTCSKKLKQGVEPTLLLSPRQTAQSSAQVDSSLPAARSPRGQAPPSASSSCTCARTSRAAQGPDGEKASNIRLSESRPQVSHCTTGATVVSSQPGVSQIVLNFREEGKSLTLDNVSTESAPQCQGGCHCLQRVVKQVVVIFLDHPRESATTTSSVASPPTVSSSTQTEARDGKSETNAQVHSEIPVHHPSHQEVVHASTQTSTCTEVSGPQEERSPETSEVGSSPGEKICSSTALSASVLSKPDQRSQNEEARREADLHCLPLAADKLPAAPKSLDKEPEHRCGAPTSIEDTRDQQLAHDQTTRNVRKCEPENPSQPPLCPHNQQNAGHFCLDPSINQYVGDLLEQYNVPPPSCIPAPVFSSRCISAERRVKQIVLNFVEQESAPVNKEAPAPSTSSNLPSPVVTSLQHRETQTCDDLPQQTSQRANEKPQCLQSTPVRPPKSHSCPPVLNIRTLRQEEERSPDHPLPQDTSLVDKVTFEDVAVYFSKEEWELLGDEEKDLYREVMADNYQSLSSLGLLQEKPDLVIRIENEEDNLWVDEGSERRIHQQEEGRWCLDRDMDGVRLTAEESDTSPCTGRESAESSSHLGALMRLVNEIPGFLLGSSVTDGSSPARSVEDHGNGRQILEVKIEEPSPASSPASAYVPVSETMEIATSPRVHRSTEQNSSKIVTKAEKTEVAVSPPSRYSTPLSHSPASSFCIKSDPGTGTDRLQIKREEFPAACSPAQQRDIPLVKPNISHLPKIPLYSPETWDHLIPERARRPSSGGGTSLSRSTAASPRNPSVSPASPHQRTKSTGLGELKIKIKQEDSGSDRDLSDSPGYGRKVYQTPPPSSTVLQAEREHWRLAASPLRSPADAPLGSSPLHRLVNCLREITTSRPRPFSGTLSTTRWVTDMSRVCADASSRASGSSTIAAPQPNPFTAAVTNGAAQLRGVEPKTSDTRAGREHAPVSPMGHVRLSALGKCLEKIQSRGLTSSEEPRRAELGVKRTHSEDLSCRTGVFSGAKRSALEVSSRVVSSCSPGHRDLWRPPEELPRAPSEDQPIGSSHLLSVMNCVRRIPGCRPISSIHVPPDLGRPCTQGVFTEVKDVKVKQEKDENPPVEPSRQWTAPPQSPDVPKQSGPVATNVHLTGLMRLMEEIPCVESSNPSRAMYSIAVGHSMARRMDRSNYLSSCNDDSGFQAELNDSTIASGDSVYSDDTSWSSENVDPSYSAIGGLQRVVSEFAELGSVSPLVAVAAPPGVQDGTGLKKPKEALTASASRLHESVRRSPREAAGVAASACSAENGEAAIAAIRGLQKVVHGFVEQECVSPITAVRNSTPNSGQRDLPGRKTCQEEEDVVSSTLSGQKNVINGVPDAGCLSPMTVASNVSSESDAGLTMKSRRERSDEGETSQKCSTERQRTAAIAVPSRNDSRSSSGSHCIDLTQEEEPVCSKNRSAAPEKERRQKIREGPSLGRPTELPSTRSIHPVGYRPRHPGSSRIPSNQLIDLTEEEETPTKPKAEIAWKPSHTGVALNPPLAENHRWSINSPKNPSGKLDKPLDPGASGSSRAGSDVRAVPAVNEHISGLEKLLKGVPTFTPAPRGSGQAWSGSWWFKSTSSHET